MVNRALMEVVVRGGWVKKTALVNRFKKITKAQASPIEPVVEPSRARLDADPTHAVGPPPDLDVEVGVVSHAAPPPDPPWGHRDLPSCTTVEGFLHGHRRIRPPSAISSQFQPPCAAPTGSSLGPPGSVFLCRHQGLQCRPPSDSPWGRRRGLPTSPPTGSSPLHHLNQIYPLCRPQLEREGGAPPCERSLFGFGN
jgi:hypothetical protein